MEINNKQRRKIAIRLRSLVCVLDEIGITEHAVIRELGIQAGIYDDCCKSKDVLTVAELIDRPICKNVSEFGSHTFAISDVANNDRFDFVCSRCGIRLMGDELYNSPLVDKTFAHYELRYCPNCGAEVER